MHKTPTKFKFKSVTGKLGFRSGDTVKAFRRVRAGLPASSLAKFQKATSFTWTEVSQIVLIPQRTLTRRQGGGKLGPDESDRLLRASTVFDKAVELFEGNDAAARRWFQTPQRALGGETPLAFASTDVGVREVENLIGRLEHGVFS